MSANWKNRMPLVVIAGLVVIALITMACLQPAEAQRRGGTASPAIPGRYSVVEPQGFNLLVTDNATNKLYYYATDKDVPVGSPMKLRASLDLTRVGDPEIHITPHNLENIRKKNTPDQPQDK